MYNPYWAPQIMGNPYLPPMVVPQQTPMPPVQNTIQVQQRQPEPTLNSPQVWNWKVVKDYQSMIQESIPFDGTPVLFMMNDSSTFYIVHMVDGKKMVNGYGFAPLEQKTEPPVATPEEKTEQRISTLENNLTTISEQIEKLLGVIKNESNPQSTERTEPIQRTPIK